MVETIRLSYQYPGIDPIRFPDIRIEAGQSLLVRGESGCGKTTLLHLLAGLRKPTDGQIIVDGQKLSDLPAPALDQFRGRHIGIVYQQSFFIQSLSILDNLLISPYARQKEKASAVARRLMIDDLMSRYPTQLSVGQLQRASIARAVMNTPKIILADEPTSALDNKNCSEVIALLREEAAAKNAALVIVTHDDRLKSEVADYIELEPLQALNSRA
ncbi:MAG: ATP-binding cassette domain-containing protein [Bacteroidota bacterium]